MASLAHHFLTLAYNNAWANHRLLKACGQLSQADFVAPRTSFFPSIKATLNHLLTVDWFYIDAIARSLNGRPPNPDAFSFFEPEEPYQTCAALQHEQRQSDSHLIALCQSLTDETLTRSMDLLRPFGIATEQRSRILSHLFQHQIHHRGQVHAMLAGTSVPPLQLDEFFCADEAELRVGDFQELGFTEESIWNS